METLLLDAADAATRVEFGMAEAEFAQRELWRASAAVFKAVDATLREAAAHPEVFIDAVMLRGDAVEFAVRAAVADLAVRLNLAEATVRSHAATAAMLRERLPRVWGWFLEGEISTANARTAADVAIELPAEAWPAFEETILDLARGMTPGRFRQKARAVRERLHPESLAQRHERANELRGVWTELDRDGMGWLNARLSAEKLAMISARLDGIAFDLHTAQDETRTMTQLRADALTDLLTGTTTGEPAVGVTVALTVPVLSLLGRSAEPAVLEGVGPIDLHTARELCSMAPSFTRLLTDPITGSILAVDARTYRPPRKIRRWLRHRDRTCTFPGCNRPAYQCDLDHIVAFAGGGTTTVTNLAHLCRKHHTLKHQTQWHVQRMPDGTTTWTSPTGHTRNADPPPF